MSIFTQILLSVGAIYALACLVAYLAQGILLFKPTGTLERTPADLGLEYEDLWTETEAGERIHGWHIPHGEARARVLFLHGNVGNVSDRLESLGQLHKLGLEVLAIDYPGYGQSTGRPTEESCYRAARASFDKLRSLDLKLPILVWGRSMGGGVASSFVNTPGVHVLVLEATFTSMPDVAQEQYPWLPARQLSRVQFPTQERLRGAQLPVLIVHSVQDEMIPFSHGQALAAAAGEQGTFVQITGTHGQGYFSSGRSYLDPLAKFLDKHLGPRS
jgi:alpha-beta hydrolase superfamily lysophospholipase